MVDRVVLPVVFTEDGWADYESLLLALLGLISPDVPVNTQIVEWWDEVKNRVLVRLTLYQGFHYTLSLLMDGARVDGDGLIDGLNTMLAFMDEPGRFSIEDTLDVYYRELPEAGTNEGWE